MSLEKFNNSDVVGASTADNQVARLKNLNDLVEKLNGTIFNNRALSFVYIITETGGVPTLALRQMKVSAGCDCCGCVDGTIADSCDKKLYSKCSNPQASMERTAPGVYNLTLHPPADVPIGDIAVRFGNVSEPGVIINLTRVSEIQYTVTAFNTQTGTNMDNILTNTIFEVLIWN